MPKRHRPGLSSSSLLRHVEDVVVATSGQDAFELVYAVAAGRLQARDSGGHVKSLRRAIAKAAREHPALEIQLLEDVDDDLLVRVDELLELGTGQLGSTLDAVFESLVPRVSKADKGQFFTPRHVVDFVVRMLAPAMNDVVVDPACGSGAFLARAREHGCTRVHGCDVDPRAVRVARLLALASGADPSNIARADGLRNAAAVPRANIIATNPPFAGRAPADGFEIATFLKTPERDALFIERALDLLVEGGRLGIILPYNKASGEAFAALRRWFVDRAEVLAIVGLPRETFLPHTSQRTFVLFARKRLRRVAPSPRERTMFVVSEKAGKDTGGEPILRGDGEIDHDLEDVRHTLRPFLEGKSMKSDDRSRAVIRALSELGDDLVLAPERRIAEDSREGTPLGDLVVERTERPDMKRAVILDTTHARSGVLDLAAAMRSAGQAKSAKKLARPGDIVVSRLRPYLRQIAYIHPRALEIAGHRPLALSSEFYVLAPREPGQDLAFLLPFLLSEPTQARLAQAQEGGHHPRVPRASLFGLRVPADAIRARKKTSARVRERLDALYLATAGFEALLQR